MNLDGQPVSVYSETWNLFYEACVDFLETYKGYALSVGRNVSLKIEDKGTFAFYMMYLSARRVEFAMRLKWGAE